ncbi:spore coat protein YsxE [Fictibacillus sp. KIGAM418]|uniref:Spore coat protein YsxE n=1 Tax=Fictibacillus marinisediminis TaxID=2878389 RepID=A0A9X2BHW1_9BACL|nr:spore coat protein YsxE [Fictibacillus marinisediminis]
MSHSSENVNYGPVLFQYDLYPEKIEAFGKVKKVISRRGTFALKETSLNEEESNWFTHVVHRLSEIGYHQVVPLYPTKYGDYTVQHGNKTYYLMPWFAGGERLGQTREEVMIDEIGKIHYLTLKEQDFSPEVVDHSFQYLMQRWETRQLEMERFAEESERMPYMSPFELTYLSHFHHMMKMAEEAKRRLKDWYDACHAEKRYRSALCHGKLSRNHLLFSHHGEPHLLNFEKAVLDTPVRDLAIFFRKAVHHSNWTREEGGRLLSLYQRHIPLLEEEKSLLVSYMSYPEPIFNSVDLYRHKRERFSQIEFVHRLEKRISAMRHIRDFCDLILTPPPPEPLDMNENTDHI